MVPMGVVRADECETSGWGGGRDAGTKKRQGGRKFQKGTL